MDRPSLPPGISWYSFLEALSTPGHMKLSDAPEKNPHWPGIDPGTLRLVAQLLAYVKYLYQLHSLFSVVWDNDHEAANKLL